MLKKMFWICALLILTQLCFADEKANVLLTLKDANTDEDISKVIIYLELNGRESTQYVPEGEIFKLKLDNGNYTAVIKIDDTSTRGMDYFKETEFSVDASLVQGVYLFPVGTVRGIVKDKLDNVVPNAKIKIECDNSLGMVFPEETDDFGTFNADVPEGQCRIIATHKDSVGFSEAAVSKGDLKDVEINLDKTLIPQKSGNMAYVLLIVIFAVIAFVVLLYASIKKSTSEAGVKINDRKEKIIFGKRAKDVIETLNDKEKCIVKFLVEEKGKTTQAKVHHEAGIPKASLFRYIQSLENKKVIEVNKAGKVKRIHFSAWFLGKEEQINSNIQDDKI